MLEYKQSFIEFSSILLVDQKPILWKPNRKELYFFMGHTGNYGYHPLSSYIRTSEWVCMGISQKVLLVRERGTWLTRLPAD